MSKTIKNVLLGFTLVCVIMLVIFIVELFVVNRNTPDRRENEPALSSNNQTGAGKDADTLSDVPTDSDLEPENKENLSTESPVQPTGTLCKLAYSLAETLTLYYDEEIFEHDSQQEMADTFTYIDGGEASLQVLFKSLPLGAERSAASILNAYLDGNESNVGGEGPIRRSSLSGIYVSGVNNGVTYEAWVHTISKDIGMAFIIKYTDNEQRNDLYAILDTLALAPSNA